MTESRENGAYRVRWLPELRGLVPAYDCADLFRPTTQENCRDNEKRRPMGVQLALEPQQLEWRLPE